MARFVATLWDTDVSSWSIIVRARSMEVLRRKVDAYMSELSFDAVPCVGFVPVPGGVDPDDIVSELAPPDPAVFAHCPLCRAGKRHHFH